MRETAARGDEVRHQASVLRGAFLRRDDATTYPRTPDAEVAINALARLLRAWLARDDVPGVCPQSVSDDISLPVEVRAAGGFVSHLLDDGPAPAARQVGERLAAQLERAIAAIADETTRPANATTLAAAATAVTKAPDAQAVAEAMWSALCPNAAGLRGDWAGRIEQVRSERALADATPAADPLRPSELLITANVMLALPLAEAPDLPELERRAVAVARSEEPIAFYDHPIPLDIDPDRHELLRGLSALDRAVAFEFERGVVTSAVPVVLSISSTHRALEAASEAHVSRLLRHCKIANLEVFAFTERLAGELVDSAIAPALAQLGAPADRVRRVFGVSGPYGRHYTFLKAIAALWNVVVDSHIRGTFKIDLDQTFLQSRLLAATGMSAFEHLCSPLWGGRATDSAGRDVALEFVAGFLVNEVDAVHGLGVPDVQDPGAPGRAEEFIFYPALPQALSTEAEMMPGSKSEVRQRVHVTGGTTGASVAGMRRLRPFSPSFWGRAEDQAFALSMEGLDPAATLHMPYLVMQHDKDSFAQDAIAASSRRQAHCGSRADLDILSLRTRDRSQPRPHWGKARSIHRCICFPHAGNPRLSATGRDDAFVGTGGKTTSGAPLSRWGESPRPDCRRFVGPAGDFQAALAADRRGWDDFYDALDVLEAGLTRGQRVGR